MSDKLGGPPPLESQLCYSIYSAGIAIQRIYKPLLDELGLTYPQYLVLNVLWRADGQTVGAVAEALALESSTLTPMLKRLEAAGLVTRTRNPQSERQVLLTLTPDGRALQSKAGCLGQALLEASQQSPKALADLNESIRHLRDTIYSRTEGWQAPI
ncbi:MarR family winged helix-turn-helix transcriptional regulator [Asticcacaulis sp. AND118]|uniref:MarR family winged helix-turn-helix transcriptional regulator n=1 Tax=Asticcacaulis sp. AND118 TaxID=2840468 RepID=UPI001CFFC925|nr:MarR family transcriptional regulator [Asticcacaulis sp. AND118]UDF05235.1 MarR family transcriptional regulator [Asticcacaulis sp. AND118]